MSQSAVPRPAPCAHPSTDFRRETGLQVFAVSGVISFFANRDK
jgi:hypothetical protein